MMGREGCLLPWQLRFDPKAPMWDFELAGTTRPLDGASLYTFSGKRRDTDLYQIASLEAKVCCRAPPAPPPPRQATTAHRTLLSAHAHRP